MVSKKHRFYGQGGIRYVNRKGMTIRGSLCTVRYVKQKNPNQYRVAVVVSKKVTKSAPKRNRIRRRVYESVRVHGLQYIQGYDVVIIVFQDKIATMPSQELVDMVTDLLSQIRT